MLRQFSPAFGHPNQPAFFCFGDPNGPFRIETDSIWRNVHLTKKLSNLARCGRIAKGCPGLSLAQFLRQS